MHRLLHARSLLRVVAVLVIALTARVHAADRDAVAQVLEDGGMRQMLASISGAADAAEAAPPGGMPGRLPDMMRLRFDPDAMFEEMTDAVSRLVSDADAAAFAGFLATPIGRRVTSAEIAHARTANPAQDAADLERYDDEDDRRRAQIARMDDALHLTGIAQSIARTVMRAMLAGMLGAQGELTVLPEELDAIADRLAAEQAEQTRLSVHAGAAGAYAAISHEDLDAYLDFLETPAAGAFYGAMLGSLRGMLDDRARLLGEDIAAAANRREL